MLHLTIPETRSIVLVNRIAKRRRSEGEKIVVDPEIQEQSKLTLSKCVEIWVRPFLMFLREPIVLCLSLLSGFSDALIFMFLGK